MHVPPQRSPVHAAGAKVGRRRLDTYDLRVIDPHVETFYADLMAKVRAIPGVRAASFSSWIPKSGTGEGKRDRDFEIEGRPTETGPPASQCEPVQHGLSGVSARPCKSRCGAAVFSREHDVENTPWVAVVNEALAHKYFAGEDPIGKRFTVLTTCRTSGRGRS